MCPFRKGLLCSTLAETLATCMHIAQAQIVKDLYTKWGLNRHGRGFLHPGVQPGVIFEEEKIFEKVTLQKVHQ